MKESEITLCDNGRMLKFKGDDQRLREMMANQQVQRRGGAWLDAGDRRADAGDRRAIAYPDRKALTYK